MRKRKKGGVRLTEAEVEELCKQLFPVRRYKPEGDFDTSEWKVVWHREAANTLDIKLTRWFIKRYGA